MSFLGHFFRIAKFSRRFAVLRLCCIYHSAVCCFGSDRMCNLCLPRRGLKFRLRFFWFVFFSNKYRNLSQLLICLGREIYSFVILGVFVFIFRDLNKQDCNRHCLEKDLFHFRIFTYVLKASPFVSNELWLVFSTASQKSPNFWHGADFN